MQLGVLSIRLGSEGYVIYIYIYICITYLYIYIYIYIYILNIVCEHIFLRLVRMYKETKKYDRARVLLEGTLLTLRVQVPNNHILF